MELQYFSTRSEILTWIPKNLIIGEIGVFNGDFSKVIYELSDPKELHLIDIFDGITVSGDKDGLNVATTDLGQQYKLLQKHFHSKHNVMLHKGKSSHILNNFTDDYFDLLYIDGDHSYKGVMLDLELSYKKVKTNGFIAGHDYCSTYFLEVYQAVNDFCIKYQQNIEYLAKDKLPSYVIRKNSIKF